ncbi:transcription termination/antitermination protein NusA [bacterium]|nr:transcription termination/antitermination protein NusA [bacterium]
MNAYEILEALEGLLAERNIEKEVLLGIIKDAILRSIRKRYGSSDNCEIIIDTDTGEIKAYAKKLVVEYVLDDTNEILLEDALRINPDVAPGDEIQVELDFSKFGRNAALSAKQELFQKLREAERLKVYEDFKHKQGEIVSGVVQRIDRGNVMVNIGKAEALLPRSEQIPGERYQQNRNIRAYVLDVRKEPKGTAQIILSRKSPEFLRKLFEFEVPEIYDGKVEIVAIAREAGERSKIAVSTYDERIDPVGACVGMKGMRVQSVVRELNNEKIDIIAYDTDPAKYIARALAPATTSHMELYPAEKKVTVVVPDEELSLAIGKGGQNARLAAKLTGWRITLFGESQYESLLRSVSEVPGVGKKLKKELEDMGIDTVQKLATTHLEILKSIPGIGDAKAAKLLQKAREIVEEINRSNAFITM